ncbi:hypothetical protein MRS44_017671 [Fusarium solani]|uniref:uncharacterized protein n=1 Tax=Fusarium solani TaxID=169388 RepID=UPI0032C49648|nr:hypothetical protein MRS44_017671 [Fusarium solani]
MDHEKSDNFFPKLSETHSCCIHPEAPAILLYMASPPTSKLVPIGRPRVQDAGLLQKRLGEDKKQHRRLQNQRNQRARRLRLKEQRAAAGIQEPTNRPFNIVRWRIETPPRPCQPHSTSSRQEADVSVLAQASPRESLAVISGHSTLSRGIDTAKGHQGRTLADSHQNIFPLPADHLLHLIHFNVTRALKSNKNAVESLSVYATLQHHDPTSCISLEVRAITQHSVAGTPASLVATQLQMTRQHSPWIGMLPWPRVRDNIIKRHAHFDHWEFLLDLVGGELTGPPVDTEDDDEITSGRQGLIVWGEPHDTGSWEVTPGFLAKWIWVFSGCREVVDYTGTEKKLLLFGIFGASFPRTGKASPASRLGVEIQSHQPEGSGRLGSHVRGPETDTVLQLP